MLQVRKSYSGERVGLQCRMMVAEREREKKREKGLQRRMLQVETTVEEKRSIGFSSVSNGKYQR